jgi:predicted PolB exonuclease-like 3'-5' exonuclease
MDVLAMYQPRNNAPLDQVAQLAGLPGKLGIGGPAVWTAYLKGEIRKIRDYCEGDCVNTYLLYLRFQRQRGMLAQEQYEKETALLRSALQATGKPYWYEFLSLWKT